MIEPHVLEILPAASRSKLERLDDDRHAASQLAFDTADALRLATDDFIRTEAAIKARLLGTVGDATANPMIGPARSVPTVWRDYERQLRGLPDAWNAPVFAFRKTALPELARRQEEAARRQAEFDGFAFFGGVEGWLRRAAASGDRLKPAKPVAVPDGDFRDVVSSCRHKLAELDNAWSAVEAAPLPVADMKSNLAAALDRIADRGEPVLDPRRREGDAFGVETLFRQQFLRSASGGTVATGDDGAPFLVWIFRGEIEKRLITMLPKNDAPNALNDIERDARFSEIAAARLEVERIEEAAICRAATGGLTIARRGDCDPRAVLGVIG